MKLKLFMMPALLGLSFISVSANAAPVHTSVPFALKTLANPFLITNGQGGVLTLNFSSTMYNKLSAIAAGDDPTGQNYDVIGNAVESVFSLPNPLPAETVVDFASNNYKADISGTTAHIVSDIAYNILAVHFGGYEVAFKFANLVQPGVAFDFTSSATKGGGLSNYRVYNSIPTTETPIPAAAWLFGSGLLGLIGATRRKSKTAAAV